MGGSRPKKKKKKKGGRPKRNKARIKQQQQGGGKTKEGEGEKRHRTDSANSRNGRGGGKRLNCRFKRGRKCHNLRVGKTNKEKGKSCPSSIGGSEVSPMQVRKRRDRKFSRKRRRRG